MPEPQDPHDPHDHTQPDGASTARMAKAGALPAGARIDEFEVRRVLGSGGFGVVYLAYDHMLQREIALKEYFPATLAGRAGTGAVTVRRVAMAESFELGMRSFVNEARLLARFDHPSLLKVHRFWEAHGTAYMVMPYYQGMTLQLLRKSMSLPPEEAWLRRLQDSLLGALEVLHDAQVYHRDIAPDNIVMLPGGAPVLLDFGAARQVLAGQTRLLTAMIKPRYAPIEQYADLVEFRQGPWTDIYASAATLYFCLTGEPPPSAAARIVSDKYTPLRERRDLLEPTIGQPCSPAWLEAIDWALEVRPQARPQSIDEWRRALAPRGTPVATAAASASLSASLSASSSASASAHGMASAAAFAPAPAPGLPSSNTAPPPLSAIPSAEAPVSAPAPITGPVYAPSGVKITSLSSAFAADAPGAPAPLAEPSLTPPSRLLVDDDDADEAFAPTQYQPRGARVDPVLDPPERGPMTAGDERRQTPPRPKALGWHWLAAALLLAALLLTLFGIVVAPR